MRLLSVLSVITLSTMAMGRGITVANNCPFTIWPAMYTGAGEPVPNQPNGWEAPASTSVTFQVPENWQAARIWGRRDCDFSGVNGTTIYSCLSGGCPDGLICTGGGIRPTTLAEISLTGGNGLDYYDISLVDGYNLPIAITNTAGCSIASCPVDLDPNCPDELKGPTDQNGFTLGCKSYCELEADQNLNLGNSPSCCTGTFSTPNTCPISGVKYYSYFKSNCPNAYAYAYDDSVTGQTALWTCATSLHADYTVTFCP